METVLGVVLGIINLPHLTKNNQRLLERGCLLNVKRCIFLVKTYFLASNLCVSNLCVFNMKRHFVA